MTFLLLQGLGPWRGVRFSLVWFGFTTLTILVYSSVLLSIFALLCNHIFSL